MALKPNDEIIGSGIAVLAVYEIFAHTTPRTADISASAAGGAASVNTHNSIKTATLESALLVGGLGLLFKSPTIYMVGALVIVFEAWKQHAANVTSPGQPGQPGQVIAPGAALNNGQPAPTLNS